MQFGLALGPPPGKILDWFWVQNGGQVGNKLAPKSEKRMSQDDIKKSSKIWSSKSFRPVPRNPGKPSLQYFYESSGLPILEYKCPTGRCMKDTPLSGRWSGGGYVYIHIYHHHNDNDKSWWWWRWWWCFPVILASMFRTWSMHGAEIFSMHVAKIFSMHGAKLFCMYGARKLPHPCSKFPISRTTECSNIIGKTEIRKYIKIYKNI